MVSGGVRGSSHGSTARIVTNDNRIQLSESYKHPDGRCENVSTVPSAQSVLQPVAVALILRHGRGCTIPETSPSSCMQIEVGANIWLFIGRESISRWDVDWSFTPQVPSGDELADSSKDIMLRQLVCHTSLLHRF